MILGLLKTIRERFATRRDSEHEQAMIRLAAGSVLTAYAFTAVERDFGFWLSLGLFHLVAWGILCGIILRPGVSPFRRVAGTAIDSTTVAYFMCQSGFGALPLFLIFLWTTFGNGFRYGGRYLLMALTISVVSFSTVLVVSDFWNQHLGVGSSLLVGMVILSLYVRALVNRLSIALLRAEAANIAKRQFVSTISHEMRTPLNAILGMSQLIRETNLNREQGDMLDTVDTASRTMLDLVNNVLDFSKIEAGKLSLNEENFDLHALVNSAAQVVQGQAERKGLRFFVSIMPDVPPYVHGNHDRLRQALINLLANAVKFTDKGEVTLHITKLVDAGDRVRLKISVRDTGVGIAPELQNRIFESFTQADQSNTRRFGGTGLGITIAKQLVDLMGGRIGVESAVGLGSTFWFEVPLTKDLTKDSTNYDNALADQRYLLVGFNEHNGRTVEDAIREWKGIVAQCSIEGAAPLVMNQARQGLSFKCAVIYAPSANEGEAFHARIARGLGAARLPFILCIPNSNDAVDMTAVKSFSNTLRLPLDKRFLFNALHSVAVQPTAEGVVFISDYLKRKDALQSVKVLIADDNATNRLLLTRILERAGHHVTAVNSGGAALNLLEREGFDLVLLDRNMPGIGGVEALCALRVLELGNDRTPVILLSADVSEEAQQEALTAGADLYLTKPVQSSNLLDAISQIVKSGLNQLTRISVHADQAVAAALNYETLAHLKALGSTDDFLDKLVHMFLEDNATLLEDMRRAAESKRFDEVRALAHALKGSAGSVGLDRLTGLCHDLQGAQEGDLRMRSVAYIESIRKEFEAARGALLAYLKGQETRADIQQ